MRTSTAILVVNGFDKRGRYGDFNRAEAETYPWIRLCLDRVAMHTRPGSYRVLVWDNSALRMHRQIVRSHEHARLCNKDQRKNLPHGESLDNLVKLVPERIKYVVILDTDAFPIRDGWLPNLIGRLKQGATLAGIWRDEMEHAITPYVHPSCIAVRRQTLVDLDVSFGVAQTGAPDVGHELTLEVQRRGGEISRLRRSNARNGHFLIGGLYGDLVYHQGAGSRNARFWARTGADDEAAVNESIRIAFRDAAFSNAAVLVEYLAGNIDDAAARTAGLGPVVDAVDRYERAQSESPAVNAS